MRKFGYRQITLAFLLVLQSAPSVANESRGEILLFEKQMEERILPIVRSFDPAAFVMIHVEPKKAPGKLLPGTPYSVEDMLIRNQEGSLEIERTEVTVFGKDAQKLESAVPLIRKFASRFGASTVVSIEADQAAESTQKEKAAPVDEKILSLRRLLEISMQFVDLLQTGFWIATAAGLLLGVVVLLGVSRSLRKLSQSIETVLMKLGASIESSSETGAMTGKSAYQAREQNAFDRGRESSPAITLTSDFVDYSEETLIACMSDCYWGEYDSYASFIWRRIPVARRASLIRSAPQRAAHLIEYTRFIANLPEAELSAINDPAYLNPLTVSHLDNATLTDLVRRNPELLVALPSLRVKQLSLTLTERLQMRQRAGKMNGDSSLDFSKISKSAFRKLERKVPIEICSVSDEEELLNLKDHQFDLVEELPSLIWSMELTDSELEEILRGFSAKDLALAWVSPQSVLNRLASCMPAKKLELVVSNLKKVSPDRNSESFKSLYQTIARALRTRRAPEMPQKSGEIGIRDEASKKAA